MQSLAIHQEEEGEEDPIRVNTYRPTESGAISPEHPHLLHSQQDGNELKWIALGSSGFFKRE
jgi:hypothetical protein